MEDIINALLDVVRAQHSATAGTDEAPFNMDDIVDMAMNLLGRPEEAGEERDMVNSIQDMVSSLAPDIFPPKTFEQMDDSEKVLSAASMIENAFMRNNTSSSSQNNQETSPSVNIPSYPSYEEEEEEEESQSTGDLNDLIYKNFMEMMGLSAPQVEFPFDRSQIQYGREKSITEQLAEEEAEKEAQASAERQRKLSAWELAQNAIDSDEAAHAKEPYVPKPVEQPAAKSASQMAAEAIRLSEERDRMQLEIERQAEAMMAEARRRGQDPMKFMLHQQEILQYMEKNTDELVSFEDYEDLSPEEKLEIERQIHIERQIAEGVNPDEVDTQVPEEYIPEELKQKSAPAAEEEEHVSTFDEDTLRALSMQVVSENSAMIMEEGSGEDIEAIQEQIFQNLKKMMEGSGTSVAPEDIGQLLAQATANSLAAGSDDDDTDSDPTPSAPAVSPREEAPRPQPARPMSAVELARAAQAAAKPMPQEAAAAPAPVEELDMNFDELDDLFDQAEEAEESIPAAEVRPKAEGASKENLSKEDDSKGEASGKELSAKEEIAKALVSQVNNVGNADSQEIDSEDDLLGDMDLEEDGPVESAAEAATAQEDDDEYEYVDPDELVLGEHTQAEIDEAMENLNTLGLEGEVFERAKRMLLLELAGSEAALDAWLYEQENSKKIKKAAVSAIDEENLDDLSDFDEDLFEKELEMAIDEDFEEEAAEDNDADDGNQEAAADGSESEGQETEEDGETGEESREDGEESGEEADEELSLDDIIVESSESVHIPEEKVIVEEVSPLPVEEISESPEEGTEEKEEVKEKKSKTHRAAKGRKNVVHKKDKKAQDAKEEKAKSEDSPSPAAKAEDAEERGYQVSVRKPFVLKNSFSYMDKLEDFITENQENRKLSTGFKKLDSMLRFGLHKGSYFIDAKPQYLKNSFMQQIADRAAESGVDVLYISTELSRYDLMVDTISRLSYEMNGHNPEKAHSVMAIMTGEDGASLESLHDELNWYRGRISEHLFILDQEAVDEYVDSMEEESAGAILEELIRSIVREGAHKPVVFIDNIENILSVEDSEDMKPLMEGIRKLAKELSIPIILSYGYAQAESEEELEADEVEFHESLGNMCDVYLELQYADMITEDSVELTQDDIREMMEDGDSLLIDVLIHRNRRPMRASCQIQGTPKYNFFEE